MLALTALLGLTLSLSPGPAPAPVPSDEPTPRQLMIAGGISLGLAGAGLGVTIARIVAASAVRRRENIITDAVAGRDPTAAEQDALASLHDRRTNIRNQALGVGLASAGVAAVGIVLLVAGRRLASTRRRLTLAPWWLTGGAGLTVRLDLGARGG